MAYHPLNLALRFALELAALVALGSWAWGASAGAARVVATLAVPAAAAATWGIFAVPDDPSRSGNAPVPVPGAVRLALELAVFGFGAWAVFASAQPLPGGIFAGLVVAHYLISAERIVWLLGR